MDRFVVIKFSVSNSVSGEELCVSHWTILNEELTQDEVRLVVQAVVANAGKGAYDCYNQWVNPISKNVYRVESIYDIPDDATKFVISGSLPAGDTSNFCYVEMAENKQQSLSEAAIAGYVNDGEVARLHPKKG